MCPDEIVARPAIELLEEIACQMWVVTEAPGRFGSFTPSPMSQDPSGLCTTSRAGSSLHVAHRGPGRPQAHRGATLRPCHTARPSAAAPGV